jgi:hypothetical protein
MSTTSRLFASLACAVASLSIVPIAGAKVRASGRLELAQQSRSDQGSRGSTPVAAATLEQCVTALAQSERSATFSGEMTAIPRSARLAMRIDIQERMPGEALFHTISAPGLGVWRESDAGVRTYRYLKQVTNLSAPALYRAAVRFRWLNAEGRAIKREERRTTSCMQSAPPPMPQSPQPTRAEESASPCASCRGEDRGMLWRAGGPLAVARMVGR